MNRARIASFSPVHRALHCRAGILGPRGLPELSTLKAVPVADRPDIKCPAYGAAPDESGSDRFVQPRSQGVALSRGHFGAARFA